MVRITVPRGKSKNPLFSRLKVADTMRRQVIALAPADDIAAAIRAFIKFKIDAVLVHDEAGFPAGVVTKTEIMTAYYGSLPLQTQLADIMGAPVIRCAPDDSLETALITMQQAAIHRIYVTDSSGRTVGTLAYPDIVGTLYKICRNCDHGLLGKSDDGDRSMLRYTIKEVMTREVVSVHEDVTIIEVIEQLAAFHFGALLIVDTAGKPAGVISKTDLALAYRRGIGADDVAAAIMRSPVILCHEGDLLEQGIRRMVFSEISRLFVHGSGREAITGVLSLSDAARMRSGSCQACSSTRIRVKE